MNSQVQKSIALEAPGAVTTKKRPLLFIAAYFAGVIIATGMITIPYINHPVARPNFTFFLERLIGITLFLPMGLVVALEWLLNIVGIRAELIHTGGPFPGPSNAFGGMIGFLDYLLMVIIIFVGSLTKKQQTFRVLYLFFIGLLIINISGCVGAA
jgi:hypothetical protein